MGQTSNILINVTNDPENGKKLKNMEKRNQKQSRQFKPIEECANTQNLLVGSSIIPRIQAKSLPEDVEVHGHRDSTTVVGIDIVKICYRLVL